MRRLPESYCEGCGTRRPRGDGSNDLKFHHREGLRQILQHGQGKAVI
jgi:hypothetical protein